MNLSITTIQADLHWENKQANFEMFKAFFKTASSSSSIIVLPEMFTTGFSMAPKDLAETMDGASVKWMKNQAIKLKKYLVGSLIIVENGNYYNRLIVATPNGTLKHYDKKHLFRYADEHLNYKEGNQELVIEIDNTKIAFFVCYDLRFPVWSRNYKLKYDVAIYIANWPEKRREHWTTLLKARAIENQSFVVGVNRIGIDGNNVSHSGDSKVYTPLGKQINTTLPNEEKVENIVLDIEMQNTYRSKFPAHLDADEFKIL